MQQSYIEQANKCVKTFMYAHRFGGFPPLDGHEVLPLSIKENRDQIVQEIRGLIEKYDLIGTKKQDEEFDLNQAVQRLALDSLNHSSDARDSAVIILVTAPIIEMLSKHYYRFFPSYRPMFEMLDNIAKISMPILYTLFDEDMPVEFRQAFPYCSQMFESYRSSRS